MKSQYEPAKFYSYKPLLPVSRWTENIYKDSFLINPYLLDMNYIWLIHIFDVLSFILKENIALHILKVPSRCTSAQVNEGVTNTYVVFERIL